MDHADNVARTGLRPERTQRLAGESARELVQCVDHDRRNRLAERREEFDAEPLHGGRVGILPRTGVELGEVCAEPVDTPLDPLFARQGGAALEKGVFERSEENSLQILIVVCEADDHADAVDYLADGSGQGRPVAMVRYGERDQLADLRLVAGHPCGQRRGGEMRLDALLYVSFGQGVQLFDDVLDLRRADRALGTYLGEQPHRLRLDILRAKARVVHDGLVERNDRFGVLLAGIPDVEVALEPLHAGRRNPRALRVERDTPDTREVANRIN